VESTTSLNLSIIGPQFTLFLASANPGKLREFRDAASVRGVAVEAVPGLRELPPCIEDGLTFAENARKKALHYSQYTAGPVFSDDSGICVDALGGEPGVYSARYAGPHATDAANNSKLLRELSRVGVNKPSAHYVCVVALAFQGTLLGIFEGQAHGLILDAPRGEGGFGYDPYFFFPPQGSTFAELTAEDKFAVSHRGAAFRRLLESLSSLLEGR
jgi:XTP/dITP diphosphohydrolase